MMDGIAGRFAEAGGMQFYQQMHFGERDADYGTRVAEWRRLQNALPFARNLYYDGHAAEGIIGGARALHADRIETLLHTRDDRDTLRHAYRFVFVDGCEGMRSASLAYAFGMTRTRLIRTDDPQIWKDDNTRPFAFVGWQKQPVWGKPLVPPPRLIAVYNDATSYQVPAFDQGTWAHDYRYDSTGPPGFIPEFIYFRSQFIVHWTGFGVPPEPLRDALHDAYLETSGSQYPVAFDWQQGLLIYGYSYLMWNKCNSPNWRSDLP